MARRRPIGKGAHPARCRNHAAQVGIVGVSCGRNAGIIDGGSRARVRKSLAQGALWGNALRWEGPCSTNRAAPAAPAETQIIARLVATLQACTGPLREGDPTPSSWLRKGQASRSQKKPQEQDAKDNCNRRSPADIHHVTPSVCDPLGAWPRTGEHTAGPPSRQEPRGHVRPSPVLRPSPGPRPTSSRHHSCNDSVILRTQKASHFPFPEKTR